MSFLIKDDKSLQKYNKIWDKTGAILLETNLILNQDTIKNTQKLNKNLSRQTRHTFSW